MTTKLLRPVVTSCSYTTNSQMLFRQQNLAKAFLSDYNFMVQSFQNFVKSNTELIELRRVPSIPLQPVLRDSQDFLTGGWYAFGSIT